MCLLTVKPANVTISDQLLRQSFADNKDGWGVARSINGELVVEKGMTEKSYLSYIKDIPIEEEAVIHTRWGNIGNKELYNCHPFRISDDFCLFHNGSITIDRPFKEMSDTFSFAFNIIAPLLERKPEIFNDTAFRKVVEKAIGTNNKLVMMRKDGKIVIFNEIQGTRHKGLWISNTRSLYGQHWGTGNNVNGNITYSPHQRPQQHPMEQCWERYCA